MNQEETISLWGDGKNQGAWNHWATQMLAERKELERNGSWDAKYANGATKGQNQQTQNWLDRATVVFSSRHLPLTFTNSVSFQDVIFPHDVIFSYATFRKFATFSNAHFYGNVILNCANFMENVSFSESNFILSVEINLANFQKLFKFNNAKIHNNLTLSNSSIKEFEFINSKVDGVSVFSGTDFETAYFDRSRFKNSVSFSNSKLMTFSSFQHTEFLGVADFNSSTFGGNEPKTINNDISKSQFRKQKYSTNFSKCKFSDSCVFNNSAFFQPAHFDATHFANDVSFLKCRFLEKLFFRDSFIGKNSTFCNSIFSKEVISTNNIFNEHCDFSKSFFKSLSDFTNTTFYKTSSFEKASFEGASHFPGCSFSGTTTFEGANFEQNVTFIRSEFSEAAYIEDCTFFGEANFRECYFSNNLIIDKTYFKEVPNFSQTHFLREAPHFDAVKIGKRSPKNTFRHFGLQELLSPITLIKVYYRAIRKRLNRAPNSDLVIRYRSLKRIAILSHDHRSEHDFFALELRSRRQFVDKVWHFHWWFSYFYELFSDYGRSISRPFFFWIATTLIFAMVYLNFHYEHPKDIHSNYDRRSYLPSSILDVVQINLINHMPNYAWITHVLPDIGNMCIDGDGSPIKAATSLSLRKSLVFSGIGNSDQVQQIYICLFGLDRKTMAYANKNEIVANVPYNIAFIGLIQNVISILFISLFILSLRNIFRLK